MNVARVKDGVVINVEVWDTIEGAEASLKEGESCIPYEEREDYRPWVGLRYSEKDGFEQRLAHPDDQEDVAAWEAFIEQADRWTAENEKLQQAILDEAAEFGLILEDQ